jgi:PhnB protein
MHPRMHTMSCSNTVRTHRIPAHAKHWWHHVQTVLGAKERMLYKSEDKRFVIHGSIMIHGVEYMVFDDPDAINAEEKQNPVMTYIYVDDVPAARAKALENGFKPKVCYFNRGLDVEDQFWGDTCASLVDPYGHVWTVAKKHGKDSKSEEMKAAEKQWTGMYDLP